MTATDRTPEPLVVVMPPWRLADVLHKLMIAHVPPLTRTALATLANVRPMTVTDLTHGRTVPTEATIDALARVFHATAHDLRFEVEASNAWRKARDQSPPASPDPEADEAAVFAIRILRLSAHSQSVVFSVIRLVEELERRRTNHDAL